MTTIKISPLKTEYYDMWKIHVREMLVKNDAWAYVNGEKVKPEAAAAAAEWKITDERTMASAEELKHISGCNISAEVLTKLKNLYESDKPTRKDGTYTKYQLFRVNNFS